MISQHKGPSSSFIDLLPSTSLSQTLCIRTEKRRQGKIWMMILVENHIQFSQAAQLYSSHVRMLPLSKVTYDTSLRVAHGSSMCGTYR